MKCLIQIWLFLGDGRATLYIRKWARDAATLPERRSIVSTLQQYNEKGIVAPCVLNMNSNRKQSKEMEIQVKETIRKLLNIPNNYHIWLCLGGAHLQFANIPLNFTTPKECAGYATTGWFSKLAFSEGVKFCDAQSIGSIDLDDKGRFKLPDAFTRITNPRYLHFVDNQTVEGVEYHPHQFPFQEGVPLIDDCSSSIFTKHLPWDRISMAYAHSQKNYGIAGITIILIKNQFLTTIDPQNKLPPISDYRIYQHHNNYPQPINTSSLFPMLKIGRYMSEQGGINEQHFHKRSQQIYSVLDKYPIYRPRVNPEHRSRISITWTMENVEIQNKLLEQGADFGVYEFRGHRTIGGLRAALFNTMPDQGIKCLRDYLQHFGHKYSS